MQIQQLCCRYNLLTSINPQLTGGINHFDCFHQFLELFFLLLILQHHHHRKIRPFISFLLFLSFVSKSFQPLFSAPESQRRGAEKQNKHFSHFIFSPRLSSSFCEKTQGAVTREERAAREYTIALEDDSPTTAVSDRQDRNF